MDVSTDSESVADTSGLSDSDTEEPLANLSDLRIPLDKGWKRETIIRGLTKNGQIRGDVFYYAPGNTTKLKHIGQVQTVKNDSHFCYVIRKKIDVYYEIFYRFSIKRNPN